MGRQANKLIWGRCPKTLSPAILSNASLARQAAKPRLIQSPPTAGAFIEPRQTNQARLFALDLSGRGKLAVFGMRKNADQDTLNNI
jgi:hypothetical protein